MGGINLTEAAATHARASQPRSPMTPRSHIVKPITIRRILIQATILTLLLASTTIVLAEEKQYGEAVGSTNNEVVSIRLGELMASPETYVDERVRIEGLVDDVCPMKGCWINILDQQSQETIRFKVEDDVIVFPAEAKGQQVVAEGILRAKNLDEAAARRWFKHLADEKGEAFDEASVSGPVTIYEIEGLGARVGK